jgi:trehalose-phosphatase
LIEDKKTTIGFHYRLVNKKYVERMKKRFTAVVRPFLGKNAVAVQSGKMVFEVKPPVEWNKGKTVNYILGKHRGKDLLPVFIGDDITDETAFKALRGKGITVHVGNNRKTAACFTLKDTGAVLQFLKKLERLGKE